MSLNFIKMRVTKRIHEKALNLSSFSQLLSLDLTFDRSISFWSPVKVEQITFTLNNASAPFTDWHGKFVYRLKLRRTIMPHRNYEALSLFWLSTKWQIKNESFWYESRFTKSRLSSLRRDCWTRSFRVYDERGARCWCRSIFGIRGIAIQTSMMFIDSLSAKLGNTKKSFDEPSWAKYLLHNRLGWTVCSTLIE